MLAIPVNFVQGGALGKHSTSSQKVFPQSTVGNAGIDPTLYEAGKALLQRHHLDYYLIIGRCIIGGRSKKMIFFDTETLKPLKPRLLFGSAEHDAALDGLKETAQIPLTQARFTALLGLSQGRAA